MAIFRILKTLLALCSCLSISFISIPVFGNDFLDQGIVEMIFLQASDSIENIEGDHLYLNSQKVCVHEQKIYLESDDCEAILLPHLCANDKGLFLKIRKKQKPKTLYICRKCTKVYDSRPTKCEVCKQSSFDVRYTWPNS